ncbi:MAG: HAD-IG family 5'-nucleotidase [Planctomycetes bacterium]|jgi:HAD superfamily 5'-nucleotidase-like hydrolase|nr:HAD-IG family 5'-nucleotidase [Planctomycetota bacterium]
MATGRTDHQAPPERALFCNRTLNMRSIRAVGFDMDYTLVHYDVVAWETRAYAHVQQRLLDRGLPVGELRFDPELFARGLILDVQLGNIVKANRFGYVTMASHGTRLLPHDQQRRVYSQIWVDLSLPRWVFLNTLFSLSEACIYGQLVDLLDRGDLPGQHTYQSLYALVGDTMNAAHLEGQLKAEIIGDPDRFVDLDPDLAQTLLDLKQAGKKLFLATNSEWHYTKAMMGYAFDRYLGSSGERGMHWRDLFDLVVVQARKPGFFEQQAPFQEVVDDEGAVRPLQGPLRAGVVYRGGNAHAVQQHFGIDGSEILYVGDHVYADVHVSSQIRRWRTALVLRELEQEVRAEREFLVGQAELDALMRDKERLDREQALLRLWLQRRERGGPAPATIDGGPAAVQERLRAVRQEVEALDQRIVPLTRQVSALGHPVWGPSMRAGNDKSRLARQIERHADVYTGRVSNFRFLTPFGYLRAARGSLPHDPQR